MINVTEDFILNGKIKILQPKNGYRVSIDPIVLAHFVTAKNDDDVLDVGCGIGTISLILKYKNKDINSYAIDIDPDMCELCSQNSFLNNLHINVANTSIAQPNIFDDKLFDIIVTNPPYFIPNHSRISKTKTLANFENIPLEDWIISCFKRLKNNGSMYIIHDATRIIEISHIISKINAGNIKIVPIYSKKNTEAKRVIVQFKKNRKTAPKILPCIYIHENNNQFTTEMSQIFHFNSGAINE